MIDSKQLKQGNKLYFNGQITTVQEILSESVIAYLHADGSDEEYSYSEVMPIPLSPEVLDKCGYVFQDNGEDFDTWTNKIELWQHDEGFCHSYCFGMEVNSLHQLQNLHYALTGEELIYKP